MRLAAGLESLSQSQSASEPGGLVAHGDKGEEWTIAPADWELGRLEVTTVPSGQGGGWGWGEGWVMPPVDWARVEEVTTAQQEEVTNEPGAEQKGLQPSTSQTVWSSQEMALQGATAESAV